jgi:hypothetical protein
MEALSPLSPVTDLERSHSELRAALIVAGREIRRLNFGRQSSPDQNAEGYAGRQASGGAGTAKRFDSGSA